MSTVTPTTATADQSNIVTRLNGDEFNYSGKQDHCQWMNHAGACQSIREFLTSSIFVCRVLYVEFSGRKRILSWLST